MLRSISDSLGKKDDKNEKPGKIVDKDDINFSDVPDIEFPPTPDYTFTQANLMVCQLLKTCLIMNVIMQITPYFNS